MKLSKKLIIIIAAVLLFLIGGGVVFVTAIPEARAKQQIDLGNKYLQEGKYQEAILAFQKVIQIDPKNIPARLGLGKAYIATKEYDKAETVLKEVICIDQNNIQAREDLFQIYLIENKFDEANLMLQEIIQSNQNINVNHLKDKLESKKESNNINDLNKILENFKKDLIDHNGKKIISSTFNKDMINNNRAIMLVRTLGKYNYSTFIYAVEKINSNWHYICNDSIADEASDFEERESKYKLWLNGGPLPEN